MYNGDIPFDPRTNHPMYYPENRYEWEYNSKRYESWMEIDRRFGKAAVEQAQRINVPPNWRPNKPFYAVLTLVDFSRGRSAANFDFKDEHGVPYTIFMKDLLELLQKHSIVQGKTPKLLWEFCKRGQNYGLKLHDGFSSNGPPPG